MSNWTAQSKLAKTVTAAGFSYDPQQDILYSRMDAPQRKLGYAYGYDKYALVMNMAIDCEPIFFEYNDMVWMIELWKGQYGLETGCEIGVYNRNPHDDAHFIKVLDDALGKRPHDSNPQHGLFFNCVPDNERLEMSFTLYRDNVKLFSRGPKHHWWLTGFKWGVYSEPSQLTMHIDITFPNANMKLAFETALGQLGYQNTSKNKTQVSFVFDRPRTYQPRLKDPKLKQVAEDNQKMVAAYKGYGLPTNDPNDVPSKVTKEIIRDILPYDHFFKHVLDTALSDTSQWLAVFSKLENFKALDFSCVVQFENRSEYYTMYLTKYGVDKSIHPRGSDLGYYAIHPPQVILPGTKGRLLLKDYQGRHGAEGWVTYELKDFDNHGGAIRFSFGCPTGVYDNHVAISRYNPEIYFYARSGKGKVLAKNEVPKKKHPLYVDFVIKV